MCVQANESDYNPTVSIIVPVHNGGVKFRMCLASLTACQPSADEIIVVADGHSDGSWQCAEEFGLQVLKTPETGGPARARNLGAKKASADLLFFLDADVTVSPDAIDQVEAAFRNDPELVAVIGSYDEEPFETNFLSQYKNLLHHYVHQCSSAEASTFWGACGAIRRETFLGLGGFDEKYLYPSIEDIELGYRLKRKGYRICLSKQLKVKHLKHWGILSLLKADFFYRALPWTDLILREGGFIDDLNLKMSARISVISTYILLLCLLLTFWAPWFFIPALFSAVLIFGLNRDLYGFFMNKRGFGFTLKTIPWHWFYYFYSGLAFAIGYVKNRFRLLCAKLE
jgi:GT2 family glycosyltransferase